MNRRRAMAIGAAVVLTVFGTIVLIAYVNAAEERAREGTELVRMLYAIEDIEAGTPASELIGSDRVAVREVPSTVRADDAVTDLRDLGDMQALETVLADTPIVARQFGDSVSGGGGGGQGAIREGREIITINLEPQRAMDGGIAENDVVGVLVSVEGGANVPRTDGPNGPTDLCEGKATAMVLSRVPVVDVQGVNAETGEAGNAITVSLDVEQNAAETITFGAEFGRVWLTRQRDDSPPPDDRAVTCENVLLPDGAG